MKLKITQTKSIVFKELFFKTCIFTLILFCNYNVFSQTTKYISSPSELTTAYSTTLVPGDIVILADGTYPSSATMKFNGVGTADQPITLKAATSGGVILTGGQTLKIGGDYVVVDGFHWDGGNGASNFIEFRDGTDYANHSTIQNCVIDGLIGASTSTTSVKHNWIVMYGTYNTVINCSFMNKATSGNMILVELAYNYAENPCTIVGHTISNNYFYKYEKIATNLTNANDSETIRIGTSDYQMVDSSCTVSNNYFVEADGENEIITNKSKNNIYTNNTFRKSRGSLVLRHGSNALVDGNYFLGHNIDGTGGIRIVDSEHTITNNYIQDCITVDDQAIWNNGITFLGGGASNSVLCSNSSTSSDYQRVENINLSNNTIINTNAPLFYNLDKGSTDPTGDVTNNLIFFTTDYPALDLTPVISGDTPTSYANLGTALTYTGNVYTGTTLGATNTGFTEETGITATPSGEIFTFSGTGSAGKGANMGGNMPITDDMVGYGIGACFLNNLGGPITDGDCTIVVSDYLTVSSLSTFPADGGSDDVTVTANVGWTAESDNPSWISIDVTSGTGNETVSVTVTPNTDTSSRSGSVTFTQDAGGDDIVRTLNVTQEGADLTDLYTLINTGDAEDPVTIIDFSTEANPTKPEENVYKTLDKINDATSIWAAEDGAVLSGDYKGDGEYITYDLGDEYNLDLIQFSTTDKSDPFGYQVLVSTDGTDFTMVLPTTGDLLLTTKIGTYDFNQYEITATARYVKIVGYGRFNSAGNTRTSPWSAIAEIEFFGESNALSVDNNELSNAIKIYPNPVKDILTLKNINNTVNLIQVFSIDGRKIIEKTIHTNESEVKLDLSSFANGTYILNATNGQSKNTKMIIVAH